MATRKIDYFGTFLSTVGSRSDPAPVDARGRSGRERPIPSHRGDPLNAVVKALEAGDLSIKDLLGHVGNSLTAALDVASQLESLGYIERRDGDLLHLTPKGREVAAVLG